MKKYVLGVDGGGTKTHCALFDLDGNRIDLISWGMTNHERMPDGFDGLKRELDSMISEILGKNNITREELGKCVFGLAGVDNESQHATISGILTEIGISDHIVCNDGILGIKAGSATGQGICLINGTGCTVIGLDENGNTLQIGGYGTLTGDVGGGAYLGMSAITGIYNSLFKDLTHTCMTDIMFEKLGIAAKEEYLGKLTYALGSGELMVPELNRIVFQAANLGDELAIEILENMGRENARSVYGILNSLEFDASQIIDIIFAGSIYAKGENSAAIDKVKECVTEQNINRQIRFTVLQVPPVAGAVWWALKSEVNHSALFDKIMNQF